MYSKRGFNKNSEGLTTVDSFESGWIKLANQLASGILPEVLMQLGQIRLTLDALVLEAGQVTSQNWSSMPAGEEAEKILVEASAIADQTVKDEFPLLPLQILGKES